MPVQSNSQSTELEVLWVTVNILSIKGRTFETAVARVGLSLFKCPLLLLSVPLSVLPLGAFKCPTAQICVLWPFNLTFQCTNMCTSAAKG
jgi:hypothetical protein